MQSKNRIAVPHTISAPISLRKAKSAARPGASATNVWWRITKASANSENVAEQKAVDRLPHDNRILADIEEQQHHQLAGEEHRRARRADNVERQGDVKNAGEIGLEEMHHPERAKKCTQADAGAGAQQSRECQKIEKGFSDKEQYVFELRHRLLSLHAVRSSVKAPPLRVPTRLTRRKPRPAKSSYPDTTTTFCKKAETPAACDIFTHPPALIISRAS